MGFARQLERRLPRPWWVGWTEVADERAVELPWALPRDLAAGNGKAGLHIAGEVEHAGLPHVLRLDRLHSRSSR